MLVRSAVAMAALWVAAVPALAEPMDANAARRFVAGKLFSFNCFEGTSGSGRIFNDGSVAGVVRMQGTGPTRFMHLPPGTLFPKGETICSHVKGAFFNPCFNLTRTSDKSFRGAISGFGFAYCDFQRRGGREMIASVAPDAGSAATTASVRPSIRHTRKTHAASSMPPAATPTSGTAPAAVAAPAAAPTQPVTSAPLPAVEQAGMRSSIAP